MKKIKIKCQNCGKLLKYEDYNNSFVVFLRRKFCSEKCREGNVKKKNETTIPKS